MFKQEKENNNNEDELPFIKKLDPNSPTYYAQMLGAYSALWKCDVLSKLDEISYSSPLHSNHDSPTNSLTAEGADESEVEGEGIQFFDENEPDPGKLKQLDPVVPNPKAMEKYDIENKSKLEIETSNLDPNITSADANPDEGKTLLIANDELFSFFVPTLTNENYSCLEGMNFIIWDATCHIMGELAGAEDHGLFDKKTLSDLAKEAFELARAELGLVGNELTREERSLVAGVAIWSLLLPRSAGGIYPNAEYAPFLTNLNEKLSKFWDGFQNQINRTVLKLAFSDFKEFAITHFKNEMEKNNDGLKKKLKST